MQVLASKNIGQQVKGQCQDAVLFAVYFLN